MKCIVINPGSTPHVLDANLEDYTSFQALVGGTFSCSELAPNLAVYYHDEGLLIGLPPNVRTNSGVLLAGTLVVSRCDDAGDQVAITPDDQRLVDQWLAECSRPFRFEYDIPAPRIFTSLDEMRAAAPEPQASVLAFHGEHQTLSAF